MAEYIDKELAIEGMWAGLREGTICGPEDTETFLRSLPAADVEPVRHGRWDGEGDGYAETEDGEMALVYDVWNCSKCGYTIDDGTDDPALLPNYCPHCGAHMDGDA